MDEFGLQQKIIVPTHKCGGILDQVITSEKVEVSEPLVSFLTSSDHGVVHFYFLQEQEHLAVKKASYRKWQNFDGVALADNILAPIDRDYAEYV